MYLKLGHYLPELDLLDLPRRRFLRILAMSTFGVTLTLDEILTGSSGTTETHSGQANPGRRFRACSLRSFSNSAWRPAHLSAFCGWRMTNAIGRSPHFGCERATTDTSRTSGCVASSIDALGYERGHNGVRRVVRTLLDSQTRRVLYSFDD